MGYERGRRRIQELYLAHDEHRRRRRGAARARSTPRRCSAPASGSPTGLRAYADAGVTTVNLTPTGFTLSERVLALRTALEAVEQASLA